MQRQKIINFEYFLKPFSFEKVFFLGENMKNIKTLIKNNILFIFVEFNFLLSIIGIFSSISAAKKEQYDNPFLFSLPLSFILWIFFAFLVSRKQETEEIEEKTAAANISYGLKPRGKVTRLQEIIIRMVLKLILAISVLIILADFTMMLFTSLKIIVIPLLILP